MMIWMVQRVSYDSSTMNLLYCYMGELWLKVQETNWLSLLVWTMQEVSLVSLTVDFPLMLQRWAVIKVFRRLTDCRLSLIWIMQFVSLDSLTVDFPLTLQRWVVIKVFERLTNWLLSIWMMQRVSQDSSTVDFPECYRVLKRLTDCCCCWLNNAGGESWFLDSWSPSSVIEVSCD